MFAEYIAKTSRTHPRRGWTAVVSFVAQALTVALLLVLPIFRTQALPRLALLGQSSRQFRRQPLPCGTLGVQPRQALRASMC